MPVLLKERRVASAFRFFVMSFSIVAALAIAILPVTPRAQTMPGSIQLLGQLDPTSDFNSDVWGWVDPNTSKEYALMGESSGFEIYIIDVTDPVNPSITSTITGVPSFDVKVWDHYVYGVDGNGSGTDGQIWDIADPANPTFAGTFASAHNIFIDDQGFMYNEVNGLIILDLNVDPTDPDTVWTGGSEGHDATVVGNTLYDFHGTAGTFIYDVTNRSSPVLLGQIDAAAGSTIDYSHSGWPSADGNYLYINDELADGVAVSEPDVQVWDISNPAAPFLVDSYDDPDAQIHNTFRLGNFLFGSYYTAGFRVFDISNPLNIELADEFDTSPSNMPQFDGAWGCYPFAPSGNIYVSDLRNGLYIFGFTIPTGIGDEKVPTSFALDQNFPNPFNPTTNITYRLDRIGHVDISVYNARGQRIRTLISEVQGVGPQAVTWDGRNDASRSVASGTYFYKMVSGGVSETKRMVLLK